MKFEDLEFKQHELTPLFDKTCKVEFDNGNGLSIINGEHAYCDSDTYEIAPLENGHLFSDGIESWGDQVKGYVTKDQINEILEHAEKDTHEEFVKYLETL